MEIINHKLFQRLKQAVSVRKKQKLNLERPLMGAGH